MKSSSLGKFILPLLGLLLAIAALRIDGAFERPAVEADPTSLSCSFTTKGFPLAVTEQVSPENSTCLGREPLLPMNMAFNWLFYSAILFLSSLLLQPPAWMKRNQTLKLVGYSASVFGLLLAGFFSWGMSLVLLRV